MMGRSCKRKKSRKTTTWSKNNKKQKKNNSSEEEEEIDAATATITSPPTAAAAATTTAMIPGSPLKVIDGGIVLDLESCCCTTPKAEKYRIPEIKTCPPAPKKRRILSNNFSLKRNPISFFSPPDLEVVFLVASSHGD